MRDLLYDCIIVGGGASGLFAASMITDISSGKSRVLVVDGNDRCGKKLALTGSGRCNMSNRNASYDKYHSDCQELLGKCLGSFGCTESIAFFENVLGIVTVCDDGLYYPATYKASTVTDSFRFYLEDNGCDFRYGSKCVKISQKGTGYEVVLKDGSVFSSHNLICATGGATYPSTGSDGSVSYLLKDFIKPDDYIGFNPALTSLTSKLQGIKALAGLRCKCRVDLSDGNIVLDSSKGEIIFTKEGGISGICVMDISGKAVPLLEKGIKPYVIVDLEDKSKDEFSKMLETRRKVFSKRKITSALTGMMPRVLCEFVCRYAGIDPSGIIANLSDKDIGRLAFSLSSIRIPVDGFGGADKAQVSSGGVKLSKMNENMQFKDYRGLYIIGEALNVDGRCGGFNLQWAWTSAACAAKGVVSDVRT